MPNGSITFNGVNSAAAGVKAVEYYPPLDRPRRKFTKLEVPGRTGDVVIFEDAWEDYEQEYQIYGGTGLAGSAPTAFTSIMEWLHSGSGYCRLEDTYDSTIYRLAYFVGPTDVDSVFSRFGRATIKFMCQGKRFLKSGETALTKSNGDSIANPTAFASRPVIMVTGTDDGSGTFTVGETTVTLNNIEDGMIIDCEQMIVTNLSGDNLNSYMDLGDFPAIPSGTSSVATTGDITSLSIVPNWFTI